LLISELFTTQNDRKRNKFNVLIRNEDKGFEIPQLPNHVFDLGKFVSSPWLVLKLLITQNIIIEGKCC
jgi:hypothetical protein